MTGPDATSSSAAQTLEVPSFRDAGSPYAVTFVCTGNICRSPMADVVFRAMVVDRGLGDRVTVSSSGTGGSHVGDGADPRTLAVLADHGFDGARHRASRFDARHFSTHDLIVAMDRTHMRDLQRMADSDSDRSRIVLLRDFDASSGDEVPDPYYGVKKDFEDVFRMVERSCRSLLDAVERRIARPQR